jgi:hypothetical protein
MVLALSEAPHMLPLAELVREHLARAVAAVAADQPS